SSRFFNVLLDEIFNNEFKHRYRDKKFDFVKSCIDSLIIETMLDETLSPRFWFLWRILARKIEKTGFKYLSDKVLLDNQFFSIDATDWVPIHGQKTFYEHFIPSAKSVKSSAKLLASIGYSEMMPDGIVWLAELIGVEWPDEKNTLLAFERVIIRSFYTSEYRKMIKSSAKLRSAFIRIVDHLIDKNASASAFLIREDFISRNPGEA
ncbi:MAG: ATPase, partial [Mucilaginibacter sp.]|nr:ATPase [Mucilaginibacter sp.]